MARQNLVIYVVVDEHGDYAVHEEDMDEAIERYNNNCSGTITGFYTIQLSVPIRRVEESKIIASVPDSAQPGDSTLIGGQVLMVKPPE
jgi:hypothetical protein